MREVNSPIDKAGAEIRPLIGTSAKITREGKEISVGDVKVGDKVPNIRR